MYSRPKPGETEEDLLRLQEEYEKAKAENKISPAATFVSLQKNETSQEQTSEIKSDKVDIGDQLANTFEAIPHDINLKNITEKKPEIRNVSVFKFSKGNGFPQAKRRDLTVAHGKGSIFSQQTKKIKREESPMETDSILISESTISIKEKSFTDPSSSKSNIIVKGESLPSQSYILTGSDRKQIHEENLEVIKSMPEAEILEEREKLIATLDPAIIAFLKSRRKQEIFENRNPTIKEQNMAAQNVNIEEIETPAELLTQPSAEKWLNFNTIETNKLAWMKNVDIPNIDKSKQFEARFDFEGWLLPYSEPEINEKNRILYHHGEEPGRPGYTLQELFQLSRSSVIQQKIIALNCIANILSLNSTGVYDDIIDIPLEQIFFVIRFCLDDNTPVVLNASIKAMRNLIFSEVDETCLDGLISFGLGHIEPVLAVDNEKEDDNTVNDQQLVEKNIIKCLTRTEILTRIRYIINTIKPSLETIVYCMDILIRLARDSDFILSNIFSCDGLIEAIITNFVPKEISRSANASSPYGLPLLQSIKLLRVLSARSKFIATKLITKYKILDSIALYLTNDTFSLNINGLRLQTECMHFWSLLIHYGLALDSFNALQPVLLNMLDYHFKNTNLDMTTTYARQGHVSGLLILLAETVERNYNSIIPFLPLLLDKCLMKWILQFEILKEFVCGKLQIISAFLYCLTCIRRYQQNNKIDEAVLRLLNADGFDLVTRNINGSMLLNNYETHKSSSNMKSLEAAAWHTMDHVIPTMQTNSCFPFLYSVSYYVNVSDQIKVKLAFLQHKNIQKYLKSVQKLEKYYLTNNWFARPESFILMNILKTSVTIKKELDTSIFYELSVKCLCVFNFEQKSDIEYILRSIIFCSKFYPSDVLLQNLNIDQQDEGLEVSLYNMDQILEVYIQVLGLKNDVPDFSTMSCINTSLGNVIPIDWIYTPILVLYSNQLQNKSNINEEQQIFTIRNCLRWILIYETYFPLLASSINPTDKFCRLACVFLGSDNLFLTKDIHNLLELCFKNLIGKSEKELNFQKDIQGLANFQDFYTQLLEQYQGVSYGDILFGNVILVPLAQKHNIQYKKTLWSEYMGIVQIFNVTPEQCIGNLELFLQPPEEDLSLLTCYRRAILNNMVRKHSVLYTIAKHHVEAFITKQRQNK
ncbi:RNA polymerase II-associated protein 1 isoform X2 [Anoplophora glabripennis]|uniref:RNA polymerase II-associated protein 1 isoform X2 n=1 Tax=Anoplophora glabripennis TaxID=217634 RepID=UPI00087427A1|nr:RNA polymerase II-associated protein 1 isoform X2 [Anoplophora glabripennis]